MKSDTSIEVTLSIKSLIFNEKNSHEKKINPTKVLFSKLVSCLCEMQELLTLELVDL